MHEAKRTRRLAIVLSVLVIVCCVSLIIGSTFAIFTANKQFPISVSGGKVDVSASLTLDKGFTQEQNGGRTEVDPTTSGTTTSVTLTDGESEPMGTITLTPSAGGNTVASVSMQNLAQGSGARFTLSVTNNSTVGMKYIAYLEKGNGILASNLEVTPYTAADEVDQQSATLYTESGTRVIFSGGGNDLWQSGGTTGSTDTYTFEISLPWKTDGSYPDITATETMTIVIEAVQSNADTSISLDTGSGTEQSFGTFEEALDAANASETPSATIKAGDGVHNIPEDYKPNKPTTITGNGSGTIINGDINTAQNFSLSGATFNGNINSTGGDVNIENATVNGTVNHTGEASTASTAATFSTLAKVSRAYTPDETLATVSLANATLNVTNASNAIKINGANLVLDNCDITLTHTEATTLEAVSITGGAVNMLNSSITVRDSATGNYSAKALYINNNSLNPEGTTNGKKASAVSYIADSSIVVDTSSSYLYSGITYDRFNEQAVQLYTARAEFSNTTVEAGNGILGFYGSTVVFTGGEIETLWYAISGNNLQGSFDITLDGARLVSTEEGSTIYLPMQNTTIIEGGTYISGYTPLEIRMGSVTINGATLESTATRSENLVATNQSTPDGSAIVLHAKAYTFASHPESSAWPDGYEDPYKSTSFYKSNTLYLQLTDANLVTKEGVRGISYYHWNIAEQPVTIVNPNNLLVTGLAADATALQELINSNYCSTLILVKDTSTDKTITFNKGDRSFTFDLNGKTLTGSNTGATITNKGTLTITGDGTIYSTNTSQQANPAVLNYDQLIIENGTFGSSQSRGAAIENFGTATINGGNFTACDNYVNGGYAYAIINGSNSSNYPDATMTINYAHVYGHMNGVLSASSGNMIVNDGVYELSSKDGSTTQYRMVYVSGSGKVVINDGTFTRSVSNDNAFFGGFYTSSGQTTSITVNGGTFEDTVHDYIKVDGETGFSMIINGGTFVDVPRVTSIYVTLTFGENFSLEDRTVTDPATTTIQAYLNAKADLVFTSPVQIPVGYEYTFTAYGSTLTGTIINYGTLTIVGQGTITNAADDKNHTITNYETLTIGEEGVADGESIIVDNLTHGTAAVHNDVGATFTFNSGKLLRSNENGQNANDNGGNSFYNLRNYGTVIINGGTIEHDGKYSSLIENGWQNGTQNTQQAEAVMVINGGTFTGGLNTIKNDDWGVLTINDGKFVNVSQACVLNWNVATINGGTYDIAQSEKTEAVILNGHINETMDKGILSVKKITYSGAPLIAWMTGFGSIDAGTITVYDAEVLQAVADVAADKTIILGDDIAIGAANSTATGLIFKQDATLDFNGYKLNYQGTAFAVYVDGATVTFEDTSESGNGGIEGGKGGNNVSLTVTNGGIANITGGVYNVGPDANNVGNSTIYILSPGGTVNISGGKFSTEAMWSNRYYVLNIKNEATGDFNVSGGEFVGYNPADGDDVQEGGFVSEGYTVETRKEGEQTIYTVVPVTEESTGEQAAN